MDQRSQPRAGRRRLTHVDRGGRPRMVDVSAKLPTARRAVAEAEVACSQETLSYLREFLRCITNSTTISPESVTAGDNGTRVVLAVWVCCGFVGAGSDGAGMVCDTAERFSVLTGTYFRISRTVLK